MSDNAAGVIVFVGAILIATLFFGGLGWLIATDTNSKNALRSECIAARGVMLEGGSCFIAPSTTITGNRED